VHGFRSLDDGGVWRELTLIQLYAVAASSPLIGKHCDNAVPGTIDFFGVTGTPSAVPKSRAMKHSGCRSLIDDV
jgi:hypothetical protein